jgi:hypothetical protein
MHLDLAIWQGVGQSHLLHPVALNQVHVLENTGEGGYLTFPGLSTYQEARISNQYSKKYYKRYSIQFNIHLWNNHEALEGIYVVTVSISQYWNKY